MEHKSPEAFRTISEVAEWLDTPAHVLRFWESRFSQIKPVKRAGGRRYYRPADMALLGGIKKLLHEDGMTIRGVQKVLRAEGVRYVASLSPALDDMPAPMAEDAEPPAAEVVAFKPSAPGAGSGPAPEPPAFAEEETPAEPDAALEPSTGAEGPEGQPADGSWSDDAAASAQDEAPAARPHAAAAGRDSRPEADDAAAASPDPAAASRPDEGAPDAAEREAAQHPVDAEQQDDLQPQFQFDLPPLPGAAPPSPPADPLAASDADAPRPSMPHPGPAADASPEPVPPEAPAQTEAPQHGAAPTRRDLRRIPEVPPDDDPAFAPRRRFGPLADPRAARAALAAEPARASALYARLVALRERIADRLP
jgi:resuscitation-promoting factor RpfA